jgi:56kDa selenium binding protein (SBP56)
MYCYTVTILIITNLTGSKNGFLAIDPATLEIKGRWETDGHSSDYGYDF